MGSPSLTVLANSDIITESNYPITKLWAFKAPIVIVGVNLIALRFGLFFPYLAIALPIVLIANLLMRANFHYSLDDKYLHVKQGVISKQQRNLPFGVIQNISVKQDLFDRIFGIASLSIENASQVGGAHWGNEGSAHINYGSVESLGSQGNKVNLPGLKKQDAEALKGILLQKMKENPTEDSQSGL